MQVGLARNRTGAARRGLQRALRWQGPTYSLHRQARWRPAEVSEIPNWFAYVAMFGWPAVCIVLFSQLRFEKAVVWSLLGGFMLLPSSFEVDPHFLPPLDKMGVTSLATLLLCWVFGENAPHPRRSIGLYMLGALLVLSPLLSSLNNSEELRALKASIPGFYPLTALKFCGRNLLMIVPMYIGSRFLASDYGRSVLLKALPTAMVFYSLPMLFEIRMSPQLHRWVYGYFPHESFAQQMRGGGFRPVVFFSHGLALALFTTLAVLAAFVLVRKREKIVGQHAGLIAAYLGGLLVLCKTLGATIYAAILAPVILFTRPRTWIKLACAISLVACAYPLLRNNDLAPTQLISQAASAVSVDRMKSFQVRVENEDALLAKANQKPWFGWGGWGRNRIYDKWTGQDISVTDGGWIIEYGCWGWVGYLALYGLLAFALFRAHRATGREITPENLTRGGLALLLAVCIVDSIPNSASLSWVFVLAGSIASTAKARRKSLVRAEPKARPAPQQVAVAQ